MCSSGEFITEYFNVARDPNSRALEFSGDIRKQKKERQMELNLLLGSVFWWLCIIVIV